MAGSHSASANHGCDDDALWERLQRAAEGSGTQDDVTLTEVAQDFPIGEAITFGTSSFYDFLKKDNRGKKAYVCNGSTCLVAGTQDRVHHELGRHFKAEEIGHMCCLGRCHENSAFNVGGKNYSGKSIEQLDELVKEIRDGKKEKKVDAGGKHYVGTSMEHPILTAPMPSLDEFYALWERVLQGDSADVLNEIKVATIRGRGGAGFPMGSVL